MAAVDSDVAVAALERALMDAMFAARGRAAPSQVARDFAIPGCQYNFVRKCQVTRVSQPRRCQHPVT